MSEAKTKATSMNVKDFLNAIEDVQKRKDAFVVLKMMEEVTGKKAVIWGTSIVGFDSYHYKYASGREGDWPIIGFSPRKTMLTVYIMPGFKPYKDKLKKLGKHKLGKSCLYIRKLADIDLGILEEIITDRVQRMRAKQEDQCA